MHPYQLFQIILVLSVSQISFNLFAKNNCDDLVVMPGDSELNYRCKTSSDCSWLLDENQDFKAVACCSSIRFNRHCVGFKTYKEVSLNKCGWFENHDLNGLNPGEEKRSMKLNKIFKCTSESGLVPVIN